MNVYEVLMHNCELLRRMHKNGIRTADYRLVNIYREFVDGIKRGDKVDYIVTILSERYCLGKRTIYRAIRFLEQPFNF